MPAVSEELTEQLAGLRRKAAGHKSAVRRERRALQDTMESIRALEARCRELGIGFEEFTTTNGEGSLSHGRHRHEETAP